MKNVIENTMITLVTAIVCVTTGAVLMHKADVSMMDKMMEHQKVVIIEAINKNTTEVINQHLTEIKKLKLRESQISTINDDEIKPVVSVDINPPKKEKRRKKIFRNKQNKSHSN